VNLQFLNVSAVTMHKQYLQTASVCIPWNPRGTSISEISWDRAPTWKFLARPLITVQLWYKLTGRTFRPALHINKHWSQWW